MGEGERTWPGLAWRLAGASNVGDPAGAEARGRNVGYGHLLPIFVCVHFVATGYSLVQRKYCAHIFFSGAREAETFAHPPLAPMGGEASDLKWVWRGGVPCLQALG